MLRCAPLRIVAGKPVPFPTLYWLACDAVGRQIAELERRGSIERIQHLLGNDSELRVAVAADHSAYAAERDAALADDERELLARHGLLAPLRARGIGGTRDALTVKCLHLHYAHHLARGSAVGRVIDSIASISLCAPVGSCP